MKIRIINAIAALTVTYFTNVNASIINVPDDYETIQAGVNMAGKIN